MREGTSNVEKRRKSTEKREMWKVFARRRGYFETGVWKIFCRFCRFFMFKKGKKDLLFMSTPLILKIKVGESG